MTPRGVLWHSTGANNPTLKRYVQPDDNAPNRAELLALIGKNSNKNDWNHIYIEAGLNAWIGKLADGTIASVQTMPWNYKPWGCGGSCNNGWMQFEICEDGLTDKAYFEAAYKEACELTAYYCKMYNLDPKGTVKFNGKNVPVILCHADSYKLGLGSNHGDVLHWFKKHGKTMEDVRNDVAALMGDTSTTPKEDNKIDGVYTKGVAVKLSTNFNSTEFDCHGSGCCAETKVDQKLVEYLQDIRTHFGKPVNISSGYRCATHNKNVGGATGSYHAKGQAADIYINGVTPAEIAKYAESIGMLGIGLYETDKDGHFVHVDTRTTKSFWYGQNQSYRSTFGGAPEPAPEPTPAPTPVDDKKAHTTLRKGSEGAEVEELQNKLVSLGYKLGNVDGDFGGKTEAAVIAFQRDNDLDDDGICGPMTWKALDKAKYYHALVTASALNVRSGPGIGNTVVGVLGNGENIIIVSEKKYWGRLINGAGYVSLEYVKKI